MLKPQSGCEPKEIYNIIDQAWPNIGPTALAWTVATWFVHEIKRRLGFFPFLSLFGDTQCGKSILAAKLNAVQGVDEEGLPMSKVNTAKGEIRKLAQLSSRFKAFLESQGQEKGRFNYDSILSLYNRNPLQVRAIKNYGLETDDLPFLGAIMFVQNREPFFSRPQKERVVSLRFKNEFLNEATAAAVHRLNEIPLEKLAYFMCWILRGRQMIEECWHEEFVNVRARIQPEIRDPRITDNHALVLAFHKLLIRLIDVQNHIDDFVVETGKEKISACEDDTTPLAAEFLNTLREIDEDAEGFSNVCVLKDNQLCIRPTQALEYLIRNRLS